MNGLVSIISMLGLFYGELFILLSLDGCQSSWQKLWFTFLFVFHDNCGPIQSSISTIACLISCHFKFISILCICALLQIWEPVSLLLLGVCKKDSIHLQNSITPSVHMRKWDRFISMAGLRQSLLISPIYRTQVTD